MVLVTVTTEDYFLVVLAPSIVDLLLQIPPYLLRLLIMVRKSQVRSLPEFAGGAKDVLAFSLFL